MNNLDAILYIPFLNCMCYSEPICLHPCNQSHYCTPNTDPSLVQHSAAVLSITLLLWGSNVFPSTKTLRVHSLYVWAFEWSSIKALFSFISWNGLLYWVSHKICICMPLYASLSRYLNLYSWQWTAIWAFSYHQINTSAAFCYAWLALCFPYSFALFSEIVHSFLSQLHRTKCIGY